ncbi:MAG: hypothetical protein GY862_37815 [Gammaproteobacteria bacterium]|nr:hypothetical protein [Gammaproteobacteria bacterium]
MTVLLTTEHNLEKWGISWAHRSTVGTRLGTNAWKWSDAANGFAADHIYRRNHGIMNRPEISKSAAPSGFNVKITVHFENRVK